MGMSPAFGNLKVRGARVWGKSNSMAFVEKGVTKNVLTRFCGVQMNINKRIL